jgi:hypothetical protein
LRRGSSAEQISDGAKAATNQSPYLNIRFSSQAGKTRRYCDMAFGIKEYAAVIEL